MTNPIRSESPPERDYLTPADLLSDDPDESVDPTVIHARTGSPIGPGTCAALRHHLRGDATVADVADALGIDADRRALRRHYRGRCAHDTDAAPVRWDATAREWVVLDDTAADSDTGD